MHVDTDYLIAQGSKLMEARASLPNLWQELADHFYPERATFTIVRDLGDEFASHLMTGAPVQARRDLAESFSSMLRRGKWFNLRAGDDDQEDYAAKRWLERSTSIQFKAMNDPRAMFKRAAKLGDNDYATFGQCVIQVTLNQERNGLLFRNWHLKDCAWAESAEGKIDTLHRNWKAQVRHLVAQFGIDNVAGKVRECYNDAKTEKKFQEIRCRHSVIPNPDDNRRERFPYCSYYIDLDNKHVLEKRELRRFEYVIPRWAHSGSQYAHSPAVMVALPDARLIQSVTLTLLEAGERFVNPPMLATQEAIRSDIQLFAGGVTWVDHEYDERLGEVLRPLTQDKSAFPVAFNVRDEIVAALGSAFYLNKITLPPMQGHDMTATEVRERVQEYIRQALPLFEPMQDEYNAALCENVFDLMFQNGGFGPLEDIPPSLRGQDIKFTFDTPLQNAEDAEKAVQFQQVMALMEQAAAVDQTIMAEVDLHEAFRSAVQDGVRAPTEWVFPEEEAQERIQELQQRMAQAQAMAQAQEMAEAAA